MSKCGVMNTVKTKKISEQYANYVESKKINKKDVPFSDEFIKKLESAEKKNEEKSSLNTILAEAQSEGRVEKPRAALRYKPTTRAQKMNISAAQAKRLAQYAPTIQDAARRHRVPVELICGVILQESGAQHKAVSHCGARGLMQLMPQTAKRFGVQNSFDPKQNIEGGTKYLAFLLKRYNGNVELAVAAYNSGEHNVEKYGMKIPPFRETRNYVPAVLGYTRSMMNIFEQASVPQNARRA